MKRATLILVMLLHCLFAGAQAFPNGLSADSVDPEADARFIKEMRSRMDKVRRKEHRPTVALVLSGGGARGSAHAGVLKLLEEMQIPVDMICGTSMGGLMGGLYGMGYSAADIDTILKGQDWNKMLSDKIPDSYRPYKEAVYRSKYMLAIPFHYASPSNKTRRNRQEIHYNYKSDNLDIGADAGEMTTHKGVSTLGSSLPSGYASGLHINNLMSSLSVGYQDSIDFADLPIPYFSVATDVSSCKAKNWGSGSIRAAMRSTMSIPGLFSPVWVGDMVLVDGGTRNNFPTDLAKAMGADIIIGVELSAAAAETATVNNVGDIMMRLVRMLGQDAYNENIPKADVLIKPQLDGYGMLSFNTEAIDSIITRGYSAALEHRDELQVIKDRIGSCTPKIHSKPAVNISKQPVMVSSIEFDGLSDHESKIMMRRLDLDISKPVDAGILEDAVQKVVAEPAFETAGYSLYGSEAPYRLVFDCERKPVHQLGLGFRMDTQDWAAILLNIGLNTNKLEGSKFEFDARISQNFYANLHYALDILALPTINVEARIYGAQHNVRATGSELVFNDRYLGQEASVYLSNSRWKIFDLKGGVRFRNIKTFSLLSDNAKFSGLENSDPALNPRTFSAFLKSSFTTFDNRYFPKRGSDLNIAGELVIKSSDEGFKKPYPVVSLDFGQAFSIGEHFSTVIDLHGRSIFNESPNIYLWNAIGGTFAGRYFAQQIPFVGFNQMYLVENNILTANLELRVNPVKNLYISAMAGGFSSGDHPGDIFSSAATNAYGFAGQIGYNTIAGPIRLRLNWSSLEKKVGFILSAGFDF